jgi:hypothetical protein
VTEPASVTDLGLERLVRIEERIGAAEGSGLRARWEFGHELLAARDGKGRLPNGWVKAIAERTRCHRVELQRRMKFAERFPSEEELAHAVSQFGSWHLRLDWRYHDDKGRISPWRPVELDHVAIIVDVIADNENYLYPPPAAGGAYVFRFVKTALRDGWSKARHDLHLQRMQKDMRRCGETLPLA